MAKVGRPTSSPKKNQMRLRVSDEEKQKIEYCAEKLSMTKVDVLRLGLDKVYSEIKK